MECSDWWLIDDRWSIIQIEWMLVGFWRTSYMGGLGVEGVCGVQCCCRGGSVKDPTEGVRGVWLQKEVRISFFLQYEYQVFSNWRPDLSSLFWFCRRMEGGEKLQ
jgi:hypothetical protein